MYKILKREKYLGQRIVWETGNEEATAAEKRESILQFMQFFGAMMEPGKNYMIRIDFHEGKILSVSDDFSKTYYDPVLVVREIEVETPGA